MFMSRRTLMAGAVMLLSGPALAQTPAPVPYLTAEKLDLTVMLPPPPPAGSALDRSELGEVVAIQKNASPARIALAVADAKETVFAMFGQMLGEKFTPANLPTASVFFDRVVQSEDEVTDPVKKFFARTRPYLASSDIKALVPASKSGSYPSGHTTRVTLTAIILDAMLPEMRPALWARADEYAESRMVGGMHYASDLDAGRRSGTAMAAVMFSDANFRGDFAGAKKELRAALGLPEAPSAPAQAQ